MSAEHTSFKLAAPRSVANGGWQLQFPPDQPLVFASKEVAFGIYRAVNAYAQDQETIKALVEALRNLSRSVMMNCQERGPLAGAVKTCLRNADQALAQANERP